MKSNSNRIEIEYIEERACFLAIMIIDNECYKYQDGTFAAYLFDDQESLWKSVEFFKNVLKDKDGKAA